MSSTVRISDIQTRLGHLTDFYLKHKIAVRNITIFPVDFDYLRTHEAEAYLHGFERINKALYFRGFELSRMQDDA